MPRARTYARALRRGQGLAGARAAPAPRVGLRAARVLALRAALARSGAPLLPFGSPFGSPSPLGCGAAARFARPFAPLRGALPPLGAPRPPPCRGRAAPPGSRVRGSACRFASRRRLPPPPSALSRGCGRRRLVGLRGGAGAAPRRCRARSGALLPFGASCAPAPPCALARFALLGLGGGAWAGLLPGLFRAAPAPVGGGSQSAKLSTRRQTICAWARKWGAMPLMRVNARVVFASQISTLRPCGRSLTGIRLHGFSLPCLARMGAAYAHFSRLRRISSRDLGCLCFTILVQCF